MNARKRGSICSCRSFLAQIRFLVPQSNEKHHPHHHPHHHHHHHHHHHANSSYQNIIRAEFKKEMHHLTSDLCMSQVVCANKNCSKVVHAKFQFSMQQQFQHVPAKFWASKPPSFGLVRAAEVSSVQRNLWSIIGRGETWEVVV